MLHMLVNTHTAESCAFRSAEHRDALLGALGRITEAAQAHQAAVQGSWVNLAGHTVFVLIDAPTAHAMEEIIREAGLIGLTDSRVYAVRTLEEAVAAIRQ